MVSARTIAFSSGAPQSFSVLDFTTFAPAAGNPVPASIHFKLNDDRANSSTIICSASGNVMGSLQTCRDKNVTFLYEDDYLDINETYLDLFSNETRQVSGGVDIIGYCFPTQPPQPNGYGTECLTYTGQVSGVFSDDPSEEDVPRKRRDGIGEEERCDEDRAGRCE